MRLHQDGWQENADRHGDEQTMTFNAHQEDDIENDLFAQKMLE
jgi:hypothetical protein